MCKKIRLEKHFQPVKNVPSSTDTLTQRMRSSVTTTGGSEIWNISLTVGILRSNLTGAGSARTVPVGERVEVVRDGIGGSRCLMRYNYRRGTQSIYVSVAEWFNATDCKSVPIVSSNLTRYSKYIDLLSNISSLML